MKKNKKITPSTILKAFMLILGILFFIASGLTLIIFEVTETYIITSIILFVIGVALTGSFMNLQINKQDKFNK